MSEQEKEGTWIQKPPFEQDESDYDLRRRIQKEQIKGAGQPVTKPQEVNKRRIKSRKQAIFHPIDGSSGMSYENKRADIVARSKR